MACHMLACFASCLLARFSFWLCGRSSELSVESSARGVARAPGCVVNVMMGLRLYYCSRTRSLEVFLYSELQKYYRVCACCLFAPPVCLVWRLDAFHC